MSDSKPIMYAFLKQAREIYEKAQQINSRMEDNEDGIVESLERLFTQREETIRQLETFMKQRNFRWSEEEHSIIEQLKEIDQKLQPLVNGLHQSFFTQITRITQTKEISKKYSGAYQEMATAGSFIDKRN
ncbi:flagellar protein FliT [Planococcus halocryophilus]|uniref:flagellar protein FliT n=1 Tax=Planococcus halocryophilus TaxID=1215089 RepID=UPI001F111CC1|nr:flagellar protein FliT [Planococcus halocryophilus]MCH4827616.1 flagellar protein FliT [Planococcus halocryophilus]